MAEEEYRRIRDEPAEALELYGRRGWLENPASYFPEPSAAEPRINRTRLLGGLSFEHFRFDSSYDPDPEDPGWARWLARAANPAAHDWVLRHRSPRPG